MLILVISFLLFFFSYNINTFPVNNFLNNDLLNSEKWKDYDIFEGDIVMKKEEYFRAARVEKFSRWPNGVIPFEIDQRLASVLNLIIASMRHIEEKSCIKFVPRTVETDYLLIHLGNGCSSFVGRQGGRQLLSLGKDCHFKNIIIHELMHVIGFFHTHMRSDRDRYVKIHWENIPSQFYNQFALLRPWQNLLHTKFDYKSILLYGPRTFSKNGRITMSSKVLGEKLMPFEDKVGLSELDIYSIKELYKCPS